MTTYRVERRIANTDQWNAIDHAETRREAIEKCSTGDRPLYAGLRIVPVTGDEDVDAYAVPEYIGER